VPAAAAAGTRSLLGIWVRHRLAPSGPAAGHGAGLPCVTCPHRTMPPGLLTFRAICSSSPSRPYGVAVSPSARCLASPALSRSPGKPCRPADTSRVR